MASLAAVPLGRHATAVVVGHAGGEVSVHSVATQPAAAPGLRPGEGGEGGRPSPTVSPLALLPPGEVLCGGEPAGPCPAIAAVHAASWAGGLGLLAVDAAGGVAQLQLHRETGAGVGGGRARDADLGDGKLCFLTLRQIGTNPTLPPPEVSAVARWRGAGPVLAAQRFRADATLLLGPLGAAALRSKLVRRPGKGADAATPPTPPSEIEFRACAGLNGSALVAAAPDALLPSRFYAATDAGQLVVINMRRERGCEVRAATLGKRQRHGGVAMPAVTS